MGTRRAYEGLVANTRAILVFAASTELHNVYFENSDISPTQTVWQFSVPGLAVSNRWAEIHPRFTPTKTFEVRAGALVPRTGNRPAPPLLAHRILVRHPSGKATLPTHFGIWTSESAFLLQYEWRDDTPLLCTSTAQLRKLQAHHRHVPHNSIHKWETALSCNVSADIWTNTWLSYRGASENTFLWQPIYRIIATQHWRAPSIPTSDPSTWCTRCNSGVQEDIKHCIWTCPILQHCWRWGENILQATAGNAAPRVHLRPENVFIAIPIPSGWQVPEKLWHLLKAILCWQIWKNRNEHYMAGKPACARKVIQKSWHRLGTYIRAEWRALTRQVRLGKITLTEARQ